MSQIRAQHGTYTLAGSNVVEFPALDKPKAQYRRLAIYPGVYNSATNKLTPNAASVFIGIDGDGPRCVPIELAATDVPLVFELPANANETQLLKDLLIMGTAGDGIFFTWWP